MKKYCIIIIIAVSLLASCGKPAPDETTAAATALWVGAPPEIGQLMPLDAGEQYVLRPYYYETKLAADMSINEYYQREYEKPRTFAPDELAVLSALLENMAAGEAIDGIAFDSGGLPDVPEYIYFKFVMQTVYQGTDSILSIFFTDTYAFAALSGVDMIYKYPFDHDGLYILAGLLGITPIEPDYVQPTSPEWDIARLAGDIGGWDIRMKTSHDAVASDNGSWSLKDKSVTDFDSTKRLILKTLIINMASTESNTSPAGQHAVTDGFSLPGKPYYIDEYEFSNIAVLTATIGGEYKINITYTFQNAVVTVRAGDKIVSKITYNYPDNSSDGVDIDWIFNLLLADLMDIHPYWENNGS